MKAFKKCICLFLSIILVMSSFIVVNAAETSKGLVGATSGNIGDCTWSFNSGVLTISGNGSMGEDQGSSYPWKSLGDSITSVVIGKGVTDVSGHAFLYQQNISSVNISETVTDIGSYAFGQCWMTSVVIPNSVKSIGAYAFHGCTSLNKVTIGNGCTTIHLQAFWNCISLKSVTIPKSVTSIGSKAFACSSLVGYSSPDTSFIIYGYPGTSAENYAKNNSLNFVSLDSNSPSAYISSTENKTNKQTVTIKLSDDGVLSGYYWGKDSNYLNNNFVSSKKEEFKETVKESGTYYLVAKDTANKTSNVASITFNSVRFMNGSSYLSNYDLLIPQNTVIGFPDMEKDGYTFISWIDNETGEEHNIGDEISISANKIFNAKWKNNSNDEEAINTYDEEPIDTMFKFPQTITAKSYNKTYGNRPFNLKAKTSGNGKLSYKSSNKKVVTVTSNGKVIIYGCGKATITIKAATTSEYKPAKKTITITVKPGKVKLKTKKTYKKNEHYYIQQYFAEQRNCDGYEWQLSPKKSFPIEFLRTKYLNKSKRYIYQSATYKGRTYYIRIRAYKRISGKRYYGKWSKTIIYKT